MENCHSEIRELLSHCGENDFDCGCEHEEHHEHRKCKPYLDIASPVDGQTLVFSEQFDSFINMTLPNPDWNSTSGFSEILNKPNLFSGNYNDLSNKPTIPNEYSLPIASSTTLGGVKVGNNLSIDVNGVSNHFNENINFYKEI